MAAVSFAKCGAMVGGIVRSGVGGVVDGDAVNSLSFPPHYTLGNTGIGGFVSVGLSDDVVWFCQVAAGGGVPGNRMAVELALTNLQRYYDYNGPIFGEITLQQHKHRAAAALVYRDFLPAAGVGGPVRQAGQAGGADDVGRAIDLDDCVCLVDAVSTKIPAE